MWSGMLLFLSGREHRGECVDGQYIAPETSDGFLPGFGFPLTIIAALGALAFLQRKPR